MSAKTPGNSNINGTLEVNLGTDYSAPSLLTGKNIKISGGNTTPRITRAVYGYDTGILTLTLSKMGVYEKSYDVTIGNETYTAEVKNVYTADIEKPSVKSVTFGSDNTTAVVSVYNPTYTQKNVRVFAKTSDGSTVTSATVTLPAETTVTVELTVTEADTLVYSAETE